MARQAASAARCRTGRSSAGRRATACRAASRPPASRRPWRAARAARSRSMPVSMPMLASMKARSSLEALPLAPGACGQPPMPASDRVEAGDADLERGVDVGQREAARVVEVAAPEAVAGDAAAPARTGRAPRAGRRSRRCRRGSRGRRRHRAAPACRRSTSAGSTSPWIVQPKAVPTPPSISVFEPAASRAARMRADLGDHLVGRLAQVGQAVRVARRQRHQHQVGVGVDRALGALQVGHQHRDEEVRAASSRTRPARRCRRAAAAGAPARTSRPRSRAGRRRARRGSTRCLRSVGRIVPDALQAVAQADFADHDPAGKLRACLVSGRAPVWCRRWTHFRHSRDSASSGTSERLSIPDRKRRSGHHRGHARHRPQDPAPARRRLRPPQHGARGRAGAHRAVGDQQAHRPARGRRSARRCWCARGAASQPTPAGLALLEHARSVLFTMERIGQRRRHLRQRRARATCAWSRRASAIAESLLDDIAVVHARAGQPQHQGRHRGAPVARPGARSCATASPRSACAGTAIDLAGPRAPALPAATGWRSRCIPTIRWRGRKSLRFEQTLDHEHVGLPPTTAVHTMLQRAAARSRAARVSYRVDRLQLRRRVPRRRRQPRRSASSRSRSARPYAAMLGVQDRFPLTDAWARAPLRDLLS